MNVHTTYLNQLDLANKVVAYLLDTRKERISVSRCYFLIILDIRIQYTAEGGERT
jgi:hypothetical protein